MQPPRKPATPVQPEQGARTLDAPTITLPNGGGAIRGIEEKFQANPATGTATFAIALPTSPGRQGSAPALALGYDSGAGNGPFGVGWQVPVPSISRRTEKRLPRYRDEVDPDVFQLTGVEDLTPMLRQVAGAWQEVEDTRTEDGAEYRVRRYRPRIEGAFARIERWTRVSDGDVHWRSTSPGNVHAVYGRSPDARIADPEDPRRVFQWLVEDSFDDRGNCIRYAYKAEDLEGVGPELLHERNRRSGAAAFANRYLKSVRYGNVTPYRGSGAPPTEFLFETVFDYGEHDEADPRPDDDGPWSVRHDPFSTCRAGFEIRTYRACRRVLLFHRFPSLGPEPRLVRAVELMYDDQPGFKFLQRVTETGYLRREDGTLSGKSLPPLTFGYQPLEWSRAVHRVAPEDVVHAPAGLNSPRYQWVDLYGEGIAGIFSEQPAGWFYKRNLGGGSFTPAQLVSPKPSFTGVAEGTLALLDVDGDGRQAAVQLDEVPQGFFRVLPETEWEPFQAFRRTPGQRTSSPHARWIDLNGDGRPELMVDEDEVFAWYESEGADGFAAAQFARKVFDEEQGPAVVFADATQTIFLADLNGDGLADIVRIRNGEIAYWANHGYGRFGAKVTTTAAPVLDHPERFDPRLIRLADIDGSGTADLIYLGHDSIRIWRNLGGNAWSAAPVAIDAFPPTDPATDVQVLDFLGEGTACIVWSSALPGEAAAPMRYIDLMGGRKPHLLVRYENSTGKEVALHYRSSARFYLDDRSAGTPWVTRLPFPVQCLHRVEHRDRVRGSYFSSEYTYHHGYFDHAEREFRGFGRVDQLDTETFDHFVLSGGTNVVDAPLHQPPVLTRTWFHTGAFLDRERVLAHFAHEYYRNAARVEHVLPEPALPDDLSAAEEREALRACKGMTLRQEVYALDGTEREPHPYSATQSSCRVSCLQPRRAGQHAAFLVTPRESVGYHYERDPADPRIAHTLVLATDELGMVLRSASIVYPRRAADATLPPQVQAEQARRVVAVSETDYTADVDTAAAYRLRVPFESRSFELTGAAPGAGGFFTPEELDALVAAAAPLAPETDPTAGLQKRLLGRSRTYFLRDDLAGPLPLGMQDTLGLPFRTLGLAFTPGLVTRLYGARVTDALLAEAGYVHSEGDADWWLPSGTAVYPADAPDHFYLATGSRDPFGTVLATVEYDPFDLLPEATEDALGNRVEAVNDYRLLGPVQTVDPNGGRAAVEADELGMVVRSALMGRDGLGEGDTLADPTVRLEYDLDNWRLTGRPNFVHTFVRERHGAANPRWQESYAYADGSGGVIMTKTQAEPGIARRWDPAAGAVEEVDTTPAVRWVGTGRTILNNKGSPVKQYEPYFSATPDFEDEAALVETGVTPVLYYDALGRLVRVEQPDGAFSTVALGPWKQAASDANDTVLESAWYAERGSPDPTGPEPADPEERAAWLAARHAGTPAVTHADVLGRPVYTVGDNGSSGRITTRGATDLTGSTSRVFDARGREVALGMSNLLGAPGYARSDEKGERWFLANAVGNTVRVWSGTERAFRVAHDALHRPVSTYFQPAGGPEVVVGHYVFGEGHPDVDALRLRGRVYQVYDQAGAMTLEGFDFRGNPLRVERRLAADYAATVDWSALVGQPAAALDGLASPLLEAETFFGTASFDALGRPLEMRLPDGTQVRPSFNEANILNTLEVRIRGAGDWIPFLENQDYDAKGQRLLAELGNGTRTRYGYDPLTYRLSRMETRRTDDDALLQDLRYTFDPVGNVTQLNDEAQQTLFFGNAVVRAEARFEYDAVYRLVRATGREHAGGSQPAHGEIVLHPLPHPNDAAAVRGYTESYDYDELGNLLRMRHVANGGSWTRHYRYAYQDDPADRTNRLRSTSLPGDDPAGPYSAPYTYDAYGNMSSMPHLAALSWSFLDQLREVDLGGGGTAHYVYNNGGQRVRKVVERPGGRVLDRIYLGGVEIYRERQGGATTLERQTVHVSDNVGRIAQVDTKTVDDADPIGIDVPVVRYLHRNHLGSAVLETDEDANLLSYEEYHPFGTTAYRSGRSAAETSLKRYRYLDRERDDETGLYHCGMRYYAAWLGRWTSPDPAGFADGLNLFAYSRDNPVRLHDPNGTQSTETFNNTLGIPAELNSADRRADVIRHLTGLVFTHGERTFRIEEVVSAEFTGGRWHVESIVSEVPQGAEDAESTEGGGGAGAGPDPGAGEGTGTGTSPGTDGATGAGGGTGPGADAGAGGGSGPGGDGTSSGPEPAEPGAPMAAAPADDSLADDAARGASAASRYLGSEGTIAQSVRAVDNARKTLIARNATTILRVLRPEHAHLDSLQRISRAAFEARNASRAASQSRLLPLGRAWSQAQDVSGTASRTFAALVNRGLDAGKDLGDAYRAVATGSGKGREAATTAAGRVGVAGRLLGGAGMVLSAYALYHDIQTENYGVVLGDAAGVVSGGLIVAGMGTAGLAVGGVALANAAGDWVGGAVEARYGRPAGVAAGTVAGMAAGAAVGALVGSIVPVIGTAVGAVAGAVIGGIAGFIGAFW